MPHFLVYLTSARPERMTPELIAAHVAWLNRLEEEGRLVICGPADDGTAIIVLRAADLEEATRLAGEDPFEPARCYEGRRVVGFRPHPV
ncbi:MAG: YciI family protein [Ferrovibrionaceae bacterium]